MLKRENSMMLFGLSASESSLKGIGLFLFVYLGATFFAAAATAPVYWAVQYLDSHFSLSLTKWMLGYEIDVFFDRLRWIPIILGLPWVLAKCGLFSLRNLGISFDRFHARMFLRFFLYGIGLSAFIFLMQLIFTKVVYDGNFTAKLAIKTLFSGLASGLILGFLEELVFRGLIMRSIYTAWGVWSAMILSSLFFAYKHFKIPDSIWDNIPSFASYPPWDFGFSLAYYDTVAIASTFNLVPFLSLFMFGMLLCAIYLRTKSLMAPMALHAGIVFCIQNYRKYFTIYSDDPLRHIFGNAGMTNGYLALIILVALFCIFAFKRSGKKV